jgi:hypothetical protein
VSFVLQWTIATALAIPLAQLALDILFYAVLGWLLLPLAPLLGGVIGLAVGGAQSLILRQHGLAGGAWIVATGGGFAAAGLLAFVALAIAAAAHPLARLALLAAISSVIGLAQLPVMRRWTPRRAWWWVPSSMAGWTAFAAVLMLRPEALSIVTDVARRLVDRAAGYSTSGSALGATLVGGLLAGAITGVALRVLGQPPGRGQPSAPARPS